MVVGDSEAEESWTAPDYIIGVWKFLQIEEDESSGQEETAKSGKPTDVSDFGQPV